MPKPPSRLPLIVGLLLIVGGWAVIYLGWRFSARLDLETGQLPYILSGGFGGFGLLLLGTAGVVIDVIQRARHDAHRSLDELVRAVEALRRQTEETDRLREEEPPRRRRRIRSG